MKFPIHKSSHLRVGFFKNEAASKVNDLGLMIIIFRSKGHTNFCFVSKRMYPVNKALFK